MKNMFALDGYPISLQLTQARIFFSRCWYFMLHLGIPFGHVPDQVHDVARVAPHVVVLAHILHEGGVQHDVILGTEDKEVGLVLKSVETDALLAC